MKNYIANILDSMGISVTKHGEEKEIVTINVMKDVRGFIHVQESEMSKVLTDGCKPFESLPSSFTRFLNPMGVRIMKYAKLANNRIATKRLDDMKRAITAGCVYWNVGIPTNLFLLDAQTVMFYKYILDKTVPVQVNGLDLMGESSSDPTQTDLVQLEAAVDYMALFYVYFNSALLKPKNHPQEVNDVYPLFDFFYKKTQEHTEFKGYTQETVMSVLTAMSALYGIMIPMSYVLHNRVTNVIFKHCAMMEKKKQEVTKKRPVLKLVS